jgi:hypothetical protein
MTRLVFIAVFAVGVVACAGRSHPAKTAASPERPPAQGAVAVYVFTAPPASRAVTRDELDRADSVKDLARRLAGKNGVALVDAPVQADVVVELVSAVQAFQPNAGRSFNDKELTAVVSGAGRTDRFSEARVDEGRTVYQLAKRVDEWVAANRPQLLAARKKR